MISVCRRRTPSDFPSLPAGKARPVSGHCRDSSGDIANFHRFLLRSKSTGYPDPHCEGASALGTPDLILLPEARGLPTISAICGARPVGGDFSAASLSRGNLRRTSDSRAASAGSRRRGIFPAGGGVHGRSAAGDAHAPEENASADNRVLCGRCSGRRV